MIHPIPTGGPTYHLVRSSRRRKTLSLRIREDGNVVIHVPYHTPRSEVERFVNQRRGWIERKLAEKEESLRESRKLFVSGEEFLYLGERYPLEILEGEAEGRPLALSFGRFILHKKFAADARNLFTAWYKKQAEETLSERLAFYSRRLSLSHRGMRITNARCRWGSCSGDNRLAFSWRIVMASLSVIDYLLIHELAHIKEKNHSKHFWCLVESVMPDYRARRLWLKRNGHRLTV
jgi:predicted metal-dependent hydrolase